MTQTMQFRESKVPFLNDWTPEQFTEMNKAIAKHFRNKQIRTRHGNYSPMVLPSKSFLDTTFGLAYTSTGKWACYGVCNTEVYFDEDNIYQYSYFTIGKNGKFYAVLQDVNENELVIEL